MAESSIVSGRFRSSSNFLSVGTQKLIGWEETINFVTSLLLAVKTKRLLKSFNAISLVKRSFSGSEKTPRAKGDKLYS